MSECCIYRCFELFLLSRTTRGLNEGITILQCSEYISFFQVTSKMPVRCTEHQDLVGEKDERGKALSANVVKSASKLS